MPELPEVETIRSGLDRLLPGLKIKKQTNNWPKSFPNSGIDVAQFMIGASVVKVRRRAKVLIIDLSTGYSLVIHLKMTGQLVFRGGSVNFGAGHPTDSLIGKLPDKSTRVDIEFDSGEHLFFNDQRKFGWMKLLPTDEIKNLDFFVKLGPEPLSADFSVAAFTDRLRRRKNSGIKSVLLDQSVVAGIGNIYADESLWAAKIHPLTHVKDLSKAQIKALHGAIIKVLKLSISKGGSTDRNYVDHEGNKGSYLQFAKVFRREGQPCERCKTIIIKTRVAGRGTHLCPKCQKIVTP